LSWLKYAPSELQLQPYLAIWVRITKDVIQSASQD
jgi:hypothetical protein